MQQQAYKTNELIFDMPSDVYHGTEGTYSSSQLKTMLEDPELFYKKYITKEMAKEESSAFDTGTYFHTAILEPHNLEKECVVFPGAIRRGKEWDAFKELHKGKAILTKSDKEKADTTIAAIKNSPRCMEFLNGGKVEVSTFVDLYVFNKNVYVFFGGSVQRLTVDGWKPTEEITVDLLLDFATKLRIKVRADSIRIEDGIISDLKSTTGNCKNEHEVKEKVANYEYDLSAALYLDIFTASTGKLFDTFALLFASKDLGNAKAWTVSEKQKKVGRTKWKKAIVLLAEFVEKGWTFEDCVGVCEPTYYNLMLLNEDF